MRCNYLLSSLIILASCAPFAGAQAAAATAKAAEHPATWRPYDLIVDLNNLPRRYSCDDLWYKFHDVLLAMGAAPGVKVLAYRCERGLPDASARSPRVQLQFSLPELLSPAQSRWAQLQAAPTTVRLAAGHPTSLASTDCELLRQMKDGLLASLSQRVVAVDLACDAPKSTQRPFDVTVQALIPAHVNSGVVAQAGGAPRT
jgi:hypothetical protein